MTINSEPGNESSDKDVVREVMEKPYCGVTISLSQDPNLPNLWLEANKDDGISIHMRTGAKRKGMILDDQSVNRLRKFLVYIDGKKLEDIDISDVREALK